MEKIIFHPFVQGKLRLYLFCLFFIKVLSRGYTVLVLVELGLLFQ